MSFWKGLLLQLGVTLAILGGLFLSIMALFWGLWVRTHPCYDYCGPMLYHFLFDPPYDAFGILLLVGLLMLIAYLVLPDRDI